MFTGAVANAESDGSAAFRERCARCHGASGRADGIDARALKVRPIAGDEKLAKMSPGEIRNAIESDPKHQCMGTLTDLDESTLGALVLYVQKLARKP
jgi:mono/diheme cytochrome c family protein